MKIEIIKNMGYMNKKIIINISNFFLPMHNVMRVTVKHCG